MKKINGIYQLSNTDIKKIEAHARALARDSAYAGSIEAWFNPTSGEIRWFELIGNDYIIDEGKEQICVCSVPCCSFN